MSKLSDYFWAKTETKENGCREWSGQRKIGKFAYGKVEFSAKGKTYKVSAHRLSWMLTNGPIPRGMCVLHKCDNPPCVNPDHLFLGTRADNNADMMRKGRGVVLPKGVTPSGGQAHINSKKTCCSKCGGPLVPVLLKSQGNRRRCPPCTQATKNAYLKQWKARQRM